MRQQRSKVTASILLALLAVSCTPADETPAETGLWFFVLVKSSNYSQNSEGELTLLNYHFFSEIFTKPNGPGITRGQINRPEAADRVMRYEDRGTNWYFEGGHFDSLVEIDNTYPNGNFVFEIANDLVEINAELSLSGADGTTEIPDPIAISLIQDGRAKSPTRIDPEKPLLVRWSNYSNGAPDDNGIVDDMIFVVIQNCQGKRIVHTGLPFENADYLTFRETELAIEANTLLPGEPYAMFVEFPHVADSTVVSGVPGFASFATATYLDIQTTGDAVDSACLEQMPAMDTGQTDRLKPE